MGPSPKYSVKPSQDAMRILTNPMLSMLSPAPRTVQGATNFRFEAFA